MVTHSPFIVARCYLGSAHLGRYMPPLLRGKTHEPILNSDRRDNACVLLHLGTFMA